MANVISVRASSVVQFFAADTGANQQNLVANPVSVLANRSYNLVDYTICITAGSGDGAGAAPNVNQARILIESVTAAGAATGIGQVSALAAAANTYVRPGVTALGAIGDVPTSAIIPNAGVPRGDSLRLSAVSSGAGVATNVRAFGTLRVFPGNRYKAATDLTSYYANNATSGAQGSNAVQSI